MDDTTYTLYDRYYYFDEAGELINVEGALGETVYDFSGEFTVENKSVTATTWLDHQENAGVIRHTHDINLDGHFVTSNEIYFDWDVPTAGSGTAKWYRVPYTGKTDQAQITAENASILAVNTWISGNTGASLGIFGAVQEAQQEIEVNPGYDILYILENIVMQIDPLNSPSTSLVGAVETVSETIDGDCGGNALVSGTGDDQTGEVIGTVAFHNYCEAGATLNGNADLYGYIDLISEELVYYVFNFRNLTVQVTGDSFTLAGTMGADFRTSPPEELLSYAVTDDMGESYWLKDLIIQLTLGLDYIEIINSKGRYYDPEYGYVVIVIEEEIRISDSDLWPSSGSMLLMGALGTKVRLTFLSANEYLVEADTDGDGAYDDYNSGTQKWVDFVIVKKETDKNNDGVSDVVFYLTYDADGNEIISEWDADNDGVLDSVVYSTYDANGNLTKTESDLNDDGVVNSTNY